MKALIVCIYFERPRMVRNALESVRAQTSPDWHLAFIDDGSVLAAEPIVREILGDDPRVTCYRGTDTIQDKQQGGGSRHGQWMNRAISECPGDVVMVLCDDDALHPDCVANTLRWFTENPDGWGYGHLYEFDPHKEKPGQVVRASPQNKHEDALDPTCRLDSTQVVFRSEPIRDGRAAYPFPATGALDASIYTQLLPIYGKVRYMGFVMQYKGVYPGQMGKRTDLFAPDDLAWTQ